MKKIIRLTEGDLHKIVKESVGMVLNEMEEGQGWNLFKDTVKRAYGDKNFQSDYEDFMKNVSQDPKEWKRQQSNYIKYGNWNGYDPDKDAYREDGDPTDTAYANPNWGDDASPRINHNLRGKIGRAAGLGASKAVLHGRGLLNRFMGKR